jgi:hypothetical protein
VELVWLHRAWGMGRGWEQDDFFITKYAI